MSTVNKILPPCKRKRPDPAPISEEDADVRRIRRIRQLLESSALKAEKKKPRRKPRVTETVLLQPSAQPDIKRKLGPGSSTRRIAWSRFELQRFRSVPGQSAGSVQVASPTSAKPEARPGTVNIKPKFSRSGSHGNSNDGCGAESSGSPSRDRLSDRTADEDSDSNISLRDYVEVHVPRATPIPSMPASPIYPSRSPSRPPSHRGSVNPLVDYSSSDDEIPPVPRSPGRHPSARVISDDEEFLQNVTLHNASLVMPPPSRPIPGKIKYTAWPLSLNGPGSNRILARKRPMVARSMPETGGFYSTPSSVGIEINESPIKLGVGYVEGSPSLRLAITGYSCGKDTVIENSMVVEDILVLDDEHQSQYTAGKGDDKDPALSPQVDESICNVVLSSQSNPAQDTISASIPRPCHGPVAITSSELGTPTISSNLLAASSTNSTFSQDTRPQPSLQGAALSSVISRTLLLTPQSGVRSVLGPPLAALDLTGRSSSLWTPAKSSTSSVLCAPFTEIPGQSSPDIPAAPSSCTCHGATVPSSFSASISAKNPLYMTNYFSHNASTPHNCPLLIGLHTPATARANGSKALPWSSMVATPPSNLPTLSQVQQIQAKKQEEQIKMARLIVQNQQLNQSSLRSSVDLIVPPAPLKSNGPWNRELEKPIKLSAERHKLPDGPVIKKTTVKEVIEIFDEEDESMADVTMIDDAAGDEDRAMVDQAAASELVQNTGILAAAGQDLEQTHNLTVSGMNVSLVCAPVAELKSRSKSTNQVLSSSVGMPASLPNPSTTATFYQSSRDSKSSLLCVFTGILYNCPPTTRKVYYSSRPSLHMEPRQSPSIKDINLTHSPHKASFRVDVLDFLIYNQFSSSHPLPLTVPFTGINKDFPRQSAKFYQRLVSPETAPSFTANPHIAWNFPTHKDNGEPEEWYVRQQLGKQRCWRKRPYCGALVMVSRLWRGGRRGLGGDDGLGTRFLVEDWQGRAWASLEKEDEWGFVVPKGLRDRSRWGDNVLLEILPESNCIK